MVSILAENKFKSQARCDNKQLLIICVCPFSDGVAQLENRWSFYGLKLAIPSTGKRGEKKGPKFLIC